MRVGETVDLAYVDQGTMPWPRQSVWEEISKA